jgi:putative membrane protein
MAIRMSQRRTHPWKGLVAGLAGGLAATAVMTQFQNAWSKTSEKIKNNSKNQEEGRQGHSEQPEAENATMKAAGKVAIIAGHPLSHEQKKKASPFVHYGFGTAMGGLYGVIMENRSLRRQQPILAGAGFGTGLFLLADEIAVPALGLSGQSESSIGTHLYGLASHLVYGATTEGVRRLARKLLQ